MPGFTESSITLNFPDANYFRLADCAGYKILCAHHFKEMDACWFDAANNLYWLIELKDFSAANLETQETIEKKSWDIVKKAVDTLCMFKSTRHGYPFATANLNPCFGANVPNHATELIFVTIIHCDINTQKEQVQYINNRFKDKFKPYAKLFGVTRYSVVEHSRAIGLIPNNMIL